MQKLIWTLVLVAGFSFSTKAQDYKLSVGMRLDFIDDPFIFAPTFKAFISEKGAIEASVGFGSESIIRVKLNYHHHIPLGEAEGLTAYFGGGGSAFFASGYYSSSVFGINMVAGLEYKIPKAPIAINFDWSPYVALSPDVEFAGRGGGLGIRYTFGN
jgi:hypothetical protein